MPDLDAHAIVRALVRRPGDEDWQAEARTDDALWGIAEAGYQIVPIVPRRPAGPEPASDGATQPCAGVSRGCSDEASR